MAVRNAVCLCSDANMLIPAMFVAVAAKSARMRLRDRYDVLLITGKSDVTETHRQWLAARGVEICDDMDLSAVQAVTVNESRLTRATLYRLLLAQHLAGRYDKILYLDADMSLHDEVAPIFDLDTGEYALAAAPAGRYWIGVSPAEREQAEAHFRALGMTEPFRYMNVGMMLIDVAKWNRDEVGARALDFARRRSDICRLIDEDALNAVLDGRQLDVSPLWNMRWESWRCPGVRAAFRPAVVHYDGPNKPWKKFYGGRRLFEMAQEHRAYRQFVRGTPWDGWLDGQWTYDDLRANLRREGRYWLRRLRGKPTPDAPAQQRAYAEAYRRACAHAQFADVDQGIVVRDGGLFALRRH